MTQFHNNRRNRSVRRCVCWCFFLCKQPGSGPPLRSPLSHRCVMEKGCVYVCVCVIVVGEIPLTEAVALVGLTLSSGKNSKGGKNNC